MTFEQRCGNSLALFCNFIEWKMFKMFEKGIRKPIGSEKTWFAENCEKQNREARFE
jgi:hypothetical protein